MLSGQICLHNEDAFFNDILRSRRRNYHYLSSDNMQRLFQNFPASKHINGIQVLPTIWRVLSIRPDCLIKSSCPLRSTARGRRASGERASTAKSKQLPQAQHSAAAPTQSAEGLMLGNRPYIGRLALFLALSFFMVLLALLLLSSSLSLRLLSLLLVVAVAVVVLLVSSLLLSLWLLSLLLSRLLVGVLLSLHVGSCCCCCCCCRWHCSCTSFLLLTFVLLVLSLSFVAIDATSS